MGKLTKRSIEALAPREIDYMVWDQDVPGFGVRVMPSGRKSFVLQYRTGRRSRRMVLGYVNVVTPEQARGIAIQHLAALRQGIDPLAERDGGRDEVTVKDLAARFDAEHIAVHLKASTQKEYRRSLKKFILPFFGNRPIAEVSREEVARFHHKYRYVPYQANRCLEILSKMFNLAELWGLRPDGSNPRKHIKKYREEKRERFLSAAELRRVGQVLDEMEAEGLEMPSAIAAVRLLILTGWVLRAAIQRAEGQRKPRETHQPGQSRHSSRRPRESSKEAMLIEMLRRPEGASITQIMAATGWQAHTCRGAFAGALKKKRGLIVTSEKRERGERIYHIAG